MTPLKAIRHAGLLSLALATLTWSSMALAGALAVDPPTPGHTPQTPLNPPPNGPRMVEPSIHALIGGTIHVSPTQTIQDGAVIIRDGKIAQVLTTIAKDWAPPADARVWDCKDLHLYAGFIDPFVEVDAPAPTPDQPGVHWNSAVTPQRSVLDGDRLADSAAEPLRKLGFTAAGLSPRNGLFRGRGAVVSLAKPSDQLSTAKSPVYATDAFHAMSFETGGGRRFRGGTPGTTPPPRPTGDENARWSGYPGSQMGSIALIRQTFMDAEWTGRGTETSCLSVLAPREKHAPIFFDVGDELESLRAAKIAREFKRPMVLIGSGTEFRRLDAIKADGLAHIIPLNFPKKPEVGSVAKAETIELRELMTWEQAPLNLKRLDDAGLKVAITNAKLPRGQNFHDNLKEAIKAGLKPDRALAMVTTTPAEILGIADRAGTIEVGKLANLVVADADLFKNPDDKASDQKDDKKDEAKKDDTKKDDEKKDDAKDDKKAAKVRDVWIDGQRHEINPAPGLKLEGEWTLNIPGAAPVARSLVFDKDNAVTIKRDGKTVKAASSSLTENRLSFVFDHEPLDGVKGMYTASGVVMEGTMTGSGVRASGESYSWSATKTQTKANPLSGDWVVVEADGKPVKPDAPGTPKVSIAKDNAVTVKVGEKSTTGKDPLVSGDTISYTYDNTDLGGEGSISDMLTLKGDSIEGVSKLPGNVTHAFKMQKQGSETKPKTLTDSWVVVEIDGKAVNDAKDPEATMIKIKLPDRREARGGRGAAPADGADKPGDKPADKSADPGVSGATVALTTVADTERDVPADNVKFDGDKIEYVVDMAKLGGQGLVSVQATRTGDELKGEMTIPGGMVKPFKAVRLPEFDRRYWGLPKNNGYPFGPYAMDAMPTQGAVALRNATVWTSGPQGVIQNGAVILNAGKVVWVGADNQADAEIARLSDVKSIDCTGKHVSPGIIDCHSHTGISRGVNEGGQTVTSEVRIQDVTNPDSISWYRQLAGGVTAVNNLHGSANPIGGQNAVNKNRWGATHPDDLHLDGRDSYSDDNPFVAGARRSTTMPGIKFALGENVKQSNGFSASSRYPATRMGVDTIIRDRFTAAREYAKAWKDYAASASGNGGPPRRDLELEALAEILEGKRLIQCHSYRQDEILALAQVAKEFGFKLGAYQHNLEGYKVAEAVKESARGASLFSDWWAYKVEVQDAIPQAGPIMHDVGVAVSYNSDSDELARRLGAEAGKAVKYGGVDPAEALKFVTLNPAIQLGIENRVGSLEAGKDADVAVWSGSPLSSLSRCEMTFVDGRLMFSLEMDKQMRETIRKERQRIVQKILSGGKKSASGGAPEMAGMGGGRGRPGGFGGGGRRPTDEELAMEDGDTSGKPVGLLERMQWDARKAHYLEMLRKGQDPRFAKCGDCGELFGQ